MNTHLKKSASEAGIVITKACYMLTLVCLLAWLCAPPAAAQVATGTNHTLAIQSDGSLWAWGYNYFGQLGDGTTTQRNSAVQVQTTTGNLANVTEVAAGEDHSLAVDSSGNMWAWGYNQYGQIGNGTTTNSSKAVQVQTSSGNLTGVIAVAAGDNFSLALRNDGTVWAVGLNSNGQLGIGNTTQQTKAVQVTTLSDIVAIAAGSTHAIALDSSGNVWTWGNNANGQLGLGTTTQETTPQLVTTLSGIGQIAAGSSHSLAMTIQGTTVYAWGLNSNGQLGNNTVSQEDSPVTMIGVSNAKTLAGGANHSVILENDGTVWTVGHNYEGELGIGTTVDQHEAVQVPNVSGILAIAARGDRTLMYTNAGTILGVGDDFYAGLGDGNVGYQLSPYSVTALSGVKQVSSGDDGDHSLAVTSSGAIYASGWNTDGQLGTNNLINTNTFVPVQTSSGYLTGITQAAAGGYHSIALTSSGTVYGWGYNTYGQVGDGVTSGNVLLPAQVVTASGNLTNITAVSAGENHSIALDSSGHVWAWGYNGNGELGNNTTTNSAKAVEVLNTSGTALSNIVGIAAGSLHNVAVDSSGNLWAWGYNTDGELGDGTTTSRLEAEQINLSGTTVTQVAASRFCSMAITSSGTALAWGANTYGELGDGTTTNRLSPVAVHNLTSLSAIYAGVYHAMAIESNGSVWTWGLNTMGELGNGTYDLNSHSSPAQISGITAASGSNPGSCCGYHNLLINSSGVLTSWADGMFGQLGDGQFGYAASPVTATFTVTQDTSGYWVDGTHGLDSNSGSYSTPFKTIEAAIKAMASNNKGRITIRAGTYYENVPIRADQYATYKFPSGSSTSPVVVRGMPGERVIISGMKQISGWSQYSGNIYSTTISSWTNAANKFPDTFYMGSNERLMAQLPAPGTAPWIFQSITTTGGNTVITDATHLAGIPSLVGGYCQMSMAGNSYGNNGVQGVPIIAHDTTNGIITLQGAWGNASSWPAGTYIVKNTVQCVTQPGEWACIAAGTSGPYTVYYDAENSTEVSQLTSANPPSQARASYTTGLANGEGVLVDMIDVAYVNIEGLEVTGASGAYADAIYLSTCTNCNVQWCTIHDNGGYSYSSSTGAWTINGYAVGLRDCANCTVSNDLMTLNYLGAMAVTGCSNTAIEQNDIGWNYTDGIDLSSDDSYTIPCANTTISQNYIHHQFNLTEHPDGIQSYDSEVTGASIANNVIMGQIQIMINGLGSGGFQNNVIWHANLNSFGNPGGGGYVGPVYYDNNSTMMDVSFGNGQPLNAQQNVTQGRWITHALTYTGDYNLTQAVPYTTSTYDTAQMTAIDTSGTWHTWGYTTGSPGCVADFSNWYQTNTGTAQDSHSYVPTAGTALFSNMPSSLRAANYVSGLQYFTTNTTSTTVALCQAGATGGGTANALGDIAVGDNIEWDMDGVVRTVTAINTTNNTITFQPPLYGFTPGDGLGWPTMPNIDWVENWGSRTNFQRSTILATGCHGLTMGPTGGAVGALLNISQYQADDFLGTGIPCVPAIPPDLRANQAQHKWHFTSWFSYGNN